MPNDNLAQSHADKNTVDRTIKTRKTAKIMLPVEQRQEVEALWNAEHQQTLEDMISLSAWAPFHRRSHEMHRQAECNAVMPWRFHVLQGGSVSDLLNHFQKQAGSGQEEKWSRAWQSKIKDMLSACGALIQVTWLPDPSESEEHGQLPEMSRNNIEHVAAAGAAVQNLLLAAEARAWQSYWSSGGILRDPEIFDFMGIGQEERLLGSIFLTPSAHPDAKVVAGGLRDQRGDVSTWVRFVGNAR